MSEKFTAKKLGFTWYIIFTSVLIEVTSEPDIFNFDFCEYSNINKGRNLKLDCAVLPSTKTFWSS